MYERRFDFAPWYHPKNSKHLYKVHFVALYSKCLRASKLMNWKRVHNTHWELTTTECQWSASLSDLRTDWQTVDVRGAVARDPHEHCDEMLLFRILPHAMLHRSHRHTTRCAADTLCCAVDGTVPTSLLQRLPVPYVEIKTLLVLPLGVRETVFNLSRTRS